MKSGVTKRGWLRLLTALMAVLAAAALWFGLGLWRTLREYAHGEDDLAWIYDTLEELPETAPDAKQTAGGRQEAAEDGQGAAGREADWQSMDEGKSAGFWRLKEWNPDLVGWVRIEGTVIDYPVMQTPEEPDYYLDHGFDREYSAYGMIYLDAGCRLDGTCQNYLLYGHHMKNGAMFASLENYVSEEYYREHPVIEFETPEGSAGYQVAAVLKLPASAATADFIRMLAAREEEEYGRLSDYVKENRLYDTGVALKWPERLLTLTTCEYSQRDGRLLVIAKKTESAD